MRALAEAGAALLGGQLETAAPMPGGDLSGIARIRLVDGREAVVKSGPSPRAEAAMLEAIRASGAPAPAVLGVDDVVLALELMPAGGRLGRAWASAGAALATLHGAAGETYGWGADYAFGRNPFPTDSDTSPVLGVGAVAIPNAARASWPEFWGEQRLLTHVPALPGGLAQRTERLASGLADRLPAAPRPALLHGDFWGGNVLVAGDAVSALIDPACYHGHGEVDIAMLELFDRPDDAFYAAYGALEPGHAERLVVYKLWPALVHLRLFGSSYAPLVERLLSEAGV